jgi:archaellum biogenesis protein FlaJ (TadC family)
MSTVEVVEETTRHTTFTMPNLALTHTSVWDSDYETVLLSICVLSCIALVVSFLKRQTQRTPVAPLRHRW